jgi:hypothetical protein
MAAEKRATRPPRSTSGLRSVSGHQAALGGDGPDDAIVLRGWIELFNEPLYRTWADVYERAPDEGIRCFSLVRGSGMRDGCEANLIRHIAKFRL